MILRRLWLIGCGNMGGAMLHRWVESGVIRPDDVDVVNRSDRDLPHGVRQARDLPTGALPDAVLLAVKPQQLDAVAARYAERLDGIPVLVSILAGVEERALAARFRAAAIFRAMPNLPVALGKGVVALDTSDNDQSVRDGVAALMAPLGLVEWVAPARFDAVTALAGCGPAFLYRFIDALGRAGEQQGLAPDQAARMALATVEGAALLAAASDLSPALLAERVASPGGSTREGLDVLDRDDAIFTLLSETLEASRRRNAEMAAAAR